MGFWSAFGLVWDRNAMFFCFKSTRAGPARGFYSQGLYETKHSGVYRTLNRRPVPGLENQGALRGCTRWPWQQSAPKAEERRRKRGRWLRALQSPPPSLACSILRISTQNRTQQRRHDRPSSRDRERARPPPPPPQLRPRPRPRP